jgi:hypothetical protein
MTRIWIVLALATSIASAQGTSQKPPARCKQQPCVQTIDIANPLNLDGKLRALSLLGFLERATEELERASLEKKSFVPKLIQTIDEAAL